MANTIIQLRHSTVQGNVPVSLANGEISINTRDGKLYYAQPDGTVTEFSGFPGPSGLNGEIQFNDSGSLGADSGLTYNKTTDILTVVGGAIIGGINVTPQIQSAYNHANAAFNQANTGGGGADQFARNTANAAFLQANTPSHVANSAAIYANGAFAAANAATATDATQNNSITAAFIRANNSLNANVGGTITGNVTVVGNLTSNTITTTGSNGSISGANAIFSNYVFAANGTVDLFIYANNAYTTANGAFAAANAATTTNITQNNSINAAFLQANTPSHVANSAAIYANGAFAAANASADIDVTQNNSITVALNTSNAAFIRANNSINANTGGIITGNLTITQNLSVGNLFVTGQVVSINASTLVANDTLIILGAGNYVSDLKDLGFAGHYNAGTNAHSGLIRDFGTKEWYLFKDYTPEIGGDNNININDASFTIDTLNANIRSTIVLSKGIDLLIRTNTIFDLANAAFAAANNQAGVNATQNTNIQYAWNHANAAFNAANTDAGVIFTSSATPPVSPNAGDFWYFTTGDILYEYINDGVSLYWIDITSSAVSTGNLTITSNGSSTADSNVFTLSGITTNGTETEIFVGGISNSRINVSANTTFTYDVVITARRTDVTGFSAGFNLKGVVDNFSGTVADVGSLYENILARDDANYIVDVRADDANNSLNIYVTGVAGHTIKWIAKVTKVEVQQ